MLGVALRDGRSDRAFAFHGETGFETASVGKVDILAALLLSRQAAGGSLSTRQRALARAMITVSDNQAAWALWKAVGAAPALSAHSKTLRLKHTTTTSANWGLTVTTPVDRVALMGALAGDRGTPLTAASRRYALGLMGDVAADQAWGVGALAHGAERAAVKNGWLSRSALGGRWIVNSMGRITGDGTDLRVAVLSRGHATMRAGVDVVEAAAGLTRRHLAL